MIGGYMARADTAAILAESGMPVVYHKWPAGSEATFPCVRYVYSGDASFRADDGRYWKRDRWSATLVSEWKDDNSEAALEAVFESHGIQFTKAGDYFADGLCHVEYSFRLSH